MQTIDLSREHRDLYTAGTSVQEIDAERGVYLTVDAVGEPGGPEFQHAVEQLYAVAYTLKFQLKTAGGPTFKIPKLECVWTAPDEAYQGSPSAWPWRLQIRLPDSVDAAQVREAKKAVAEKGKTDPRDVRRRSWKEGRALKVLHVGPYAKLGESYERLSARAEELGYRRRGPFLDVYLSDPRRTAPEKLKTIVRMPISH